MLKALLSILTCCLISVSALAQSRTAYSEFGGGVGTLNYSGDIATTFGVSAVLKEVRPQFFVFAKRHFNHIFGAGAEANFGWIYGSDENHTNVTRGLSNHTTITQVNGFVELHLAKFGKYHIDRKSALYIKAGLGFLAYNTNISASRTFPNDIELFPDAYSGIHYFGGGGIKFRLTYHSVLAIEVLASNAGTNQLDGFVYRSGQGSSNDLFGGLRISYSYLVF